MTNTLPIVNAIKAKDWTTATEGVRFVLDQKVQERLAQERVQVGRGLVKEAKDPENYFGGSDEEGWVLYHQGQPLNANPQGGQPVDRDRVKRVAKQHGIALTIPVWNGKDFSGTIDECSTGKK